MEPIAPIPESDTPPNSKGGMIAAIGGLVLASLLIAGIVPRIKQGKTLASETADINQSVREVNVVTPRETKADALLLPGNIRALEDTAIYARTNGFLAKRYVDIGSRVKAGDVLAEIESPDVDQQALQAMADQAKAVATVGQSRADVLSKQASVIETQSEVARSQAGIAQAKAMLSGSEAKLIQAKAALASYQSRVAQARKALESQNSSLKQAEAQRDLAEATAKRYRELLQEGFVAQQDADQAEATLKTTSAAVDSARSAIGAAEADVDAAIHDSESGKALVNSAQADVQSSRENVSAAKAALASTVANVSAAKANVGASEANVTESIAQVNSNQANTKRYDVLKGFSRIIAPFDGVITLRNADVGSLIAPGDSSNTKLELFTMARVDTLRIQVGVPQTYFQAVKPGTPVIIRVRELPGKKFAGAVYQNAGAIDENTRTMLTEVRVPNKDNLLIPGMYAQVEFSPSGNPTALRIPSNTLMIAAQGPQVLVVGSDSKLKFVSVKIGRDFGSEVEIVSGLVGDEKLVTNPTDDLKQDQPVKIIASQETKKS